VPESPRSDRDRRRISTAAAAALCVLWFFGSLWITRGYYPASPDSLRSAIIARNLVRGDGFTLSMVPYHAGRFASVEHVSEMHAVLQPVLLAGWFALAGPQQSLLRLPGFVYLALTGFVAFAYARRSFGAGAGWIACVLTLCSGVLWLWAWFGTDDAGFAFWFVLALYALDVALARRSGPRFLLAGLAAAMALLQKLSGLVLLAPLLAVAFTRDAPLRVRLRWAAAWLAPWSLALALLLERNRLASGSWGFRFGPIGWIYKASGLEAYLAVFDPVPSQASVLASLGVERLFAIVLADFAGFARALSPTPLLAADPIHHLFTPGFLALAGLAALAYHARRAPRFALLSTLAVAGVIGFVCVLWHYETRYFAPLVPVLAISFAGAVAASVTAAKARRGATLASVVAAGGLAGVALSLAAFALALPAIPLYGGEVPCGAAREWIREHTAERDRVLTLDPSTTAWQSDRSTIMVPSGPRADVEKVVAWYRPEWLFVQPRPDRDASVARLREMIASPSPAFAAEVAFVAGECEVYRLAPPASAGPSAP